jgi:signal peptidase I
MLTRIGEELLAWFKTLVSAAVYATLIVTFGFQVARVEGQSMAPTLEDQDRLIVNKLAYRLHDPRVGDIVMLLYPEDPGRSSSACGGTGRCHSQRRRPCTGTTCRCR